MSWERDNGWGKQLTFRYPKVDIWTHTHTHISSCSWSSCYKHPKHLYIQRTRIQFLSFYYIKWKLLFINTIFFSLSFFSLASVLDSSDSRYMKEVGNTLNCLLKNLLVGWWLKRINLNLSSLLIISGFRKNLS